VGEQDRAATRGEHAEGLVLVERIEKEKGGPYGPRGVVCSLAATLGVYDAFDGLVPPNWGHPVPKRSGYDGGVLRWADEVIDSDAVHDDGLGYRGVDLALYRERRRFPSGLRRQRAIVMGIDESALVTSHIGI